MTSPIQTLQMLAGAYAAVLMSLGPNALIVINNGVKDRKLGIASALGVLPVSLFYASCGLLGIGTIINTMPSLKTVMLLACGCYLFYLGLREILASLKVAPEDKKEPENLSFRDAFLMGFISNITNPKAIAFFISVFAATGSYTLPLSYQLAICPIVGIINFGWYGLLALLASSTVTRFLINKAGPWFKRVSGMVMIGFAVGLLIQAAEAAHL